MLQDPVWTWDIPAYFYVGGVAGTSAAFGSLLRIVDAGGNRAAIVRCRQIAAAGAILSAVLLIHDLGRPARFLYMLRVFRPTSPMSVGSWILAAFGASASGAFLFGGWIGTVAQCASGLLGLPLSTYTAVLIANTAVPVWRDSRRSLPFLFAGSSMAGAASLLEMTLARGSTPVSLLAAAGGVTEMIASQGNQVDGVLWNAARVFSAASLVISVWPGKARGKRVVSGLLGTAAAIAFRFAVVYAGKRSVRNSLAGA